MDVYYVPIMLAKTNKLLEVETKLRESLEADVEKLEKNVRKYRKRSHTADGELKRLSAQISDTYRTLLGNNF